MLRTCEECGRPFARARARQAKCDTCEPPGRAMRSPTTRAQDAAYRRERDRILAGSPLCHWCGVNPATTADHVKPVARGGRHTGNLVPCCAGCNASKQDQPRPTVASSDLRGSDRAAPQPRGVRLA
jgi:5-methylcytosine-specific restriction endonuclease McrA